MDRRSAPRRRSQREGQGVPQDAERRREGREATAMTEHGAAEEGLALGDERAWTTAVPRPAAEPQDRSPGFPLGVYSVNV